MGKYKSQQQTHIRRQRNKDAFFEVVESYIDMHSKSTTKVMDMSQQGGGTSNPASPSLLDFFCDVENTMKRALKDNELLQKATKHYIMGDEILTKSQENYVEQRVGALFVNRGIWPITKYFLTIRKKKGE